VATSHVAIVRAPPSIIRRVIVSVVVGIVHIGIIVLRNTELSLVLFAEFVRLRRRAARAELFVDFIVTLLELYATSY
jgi:hypothetical protein